MFGPHSRAYWKNFTEGHQSQYCFKASTLNLEFFTSLAPEKKMHAIAMSRTTQNFYALLNCIVIYIYILGTPLVQVLDEFIHVPLHLEGCRELLLVHASLTVPAITPILHLP